MAEKHLQKLKQQIIEEPEQTQSSSNKIGKCLGIPALTPFVVLCLPFLCVMCSFLWKSLSWNYSDKIVLFHLFTALLKEFSHCWISHSRQQTREYFWEDRAHTDRLHSFSSESVALSCLPPPPILLLVTDLFCWMLDRCSRVFTVTDLGSRLAQRWEPCLALQVSVSSVEHLISSCILPPSMHIISHGDLYWLLASFLLLRIGSSCVCVGGGACSLAPLFCKHPISWLPKSSFLHMPSALFFLFYGKWSLPSNVRMHSFFRGSVGSSHWPRPFLPQNKI